MQQAIDELSVACFFMLAKNVKTKQSEEVEKGSLLRQWLSISTIPPPVGQKNLILPYLVLVHEKAYFHLKIPPL